MRYLLFIFFLQMFFYSNSQDLNKTDSLGYKQGDWVYENIHSVQGKEIHCTYKDDVIQGIYTGYQYDKIRFEVFYIDGKKHGIEKIYSDKLVLIYLNSFEDGYLVNQMFFRDNGKLYSQESFNKKGKKHGFNSIYFKNVKIKTRMFYSNGLAQGDEVRYKKNGKIFSITTFKNDIIVNVELFK